MKIQKNEHGTKNLWNLDAQLKWILTHNSNWPGSKKPNKTGSTRYPAFPTPTRLIRKLGAFEVGYLKDAVNILDSLEQRDDQSWTVLIGDSITSDQRQKITK